jgi:hypothetical protein
MICRRGTYANPTVGIIAAGLHPFGRGRGHFCHLQSALPDHTARLTIAIDCSIVRRVRVQYRKGLGSYTEVWGICSYVPSFGTLAASDANRRGRPLLLLPVAASSNFGTRNCVHGHRRGAIPLPIFPAKCSNLVAGETWDALVLHVDLASSPKRDEQRE